MSESPVVNEQTPSGSFALTFVQGAFRNGQCCARRSSLAGADKSSTARPKTSPKGSCDINEPFLLVGDHSAVVNVASVPKLSPFRYPGGKTWLVPTVLKWVSSFWRRPKFFIEPFAGGGIVGLSIAFQGLADEVILCELDDGVASVWQTILGPDCNWLIDQILEFKIIRENVLKRLNVIPLSRRELAFHTILRNRVQRGGILAPGASLVNGGENGKGVASRWYPLTLATRMTEIHKRRDRIKFIQGDAFKVLPPYLRSVKNTFFVDPPYTAGGKSAGSRLYLHSVISHTNLFTLMSRAKGPVMLTYDDCTTVETLAASHGFSCARQPMKNTHHNVLKELLITNNAAFVEQSRRAQLVAELSA